MLFVVCSLCCLCCLCCFLCAGDTSEQQYVKDMEGLADVDYHSYAMANSIHYDLSELIEGPIIRKSIRSFWLLNQRMPLACPGTPLTDDQWRNMKAKMGNRGIKRSRTTSQKSPLQIKHNRIREYGVEMLAWYNTNRYTSWMLHTIVNELWYENLETSFLQVRYVLRGH